MGDMAGFFIWALGMLVFFAASFDYSQQVGRRAGQILATWIRRPRVAMPRPTVRLKRSQLWDLGLPWIDLESGEIQFPPPGWTEPQLPGQTSADLRELAWGRGVVLERWASCPVRPALSPDDLRYAAGAWAMCSDPLSAHARYDLPSGRSLRADDVQAIREWYRGLQR